MISVEHWGWIDKKQVFLYTITNSGGGCVELSNFGARVVAVRVPDRAGVLDNVVLGFSELEGYIHDKDYLGATIGRVANRIAGGQFRLDEGLYQLEINDGQNSNHGGSQGFHKQVFDGAIDGNSVVFSLNSPDGAGGYPGNLNLKVIYSWDEQQLLRITYRGCSDKKTILNLTNHSYFNLSGLSRDVLAHQLSIYAKGVIETDAAFIPTGHVRKIGDFAIHGDMLKNKMEVAHKHEEVRSGMDSSGLGRTKKDIQGFNDCYVLMSYGACDSNRANELGTSFPPACILSEEKSGRRLTVWTSYPGLLLYTGDYLQSDYKGYHNRTYRAFDGLSLECQYYPDSPHYPGFPSVILDAGKEYKESILFKFEVTDQLSEHLT